MVASLLRRERGRVRNRSGQLARAGVTTPHLNPLPLSKGRGGALQAGLVPMPFLRSLDRFWPKSYKHVASNGALHGLFTKASY
jgi:hypothetical protein